MAADDLLLRAPPEGQPPPGLYHIIVEIRPPGTNAYVLTPMTDRALSLDLIPQERKHQTLKEAAAAAKQLPANVAVYAGREDMFRPGTNSLRALSVDEISEFRRLLSE